MQPELAQLLERYHDGEVSPDETARVESLLESDSEALAYLGGLDEMTTSYRHVIEDQLDGVQFDGLWARIHEQIQPEATTPVAAEAPRPANSVIAFLTSLFSDHKGAWIAAAATACAVAVVMSFVGGPTERVIEKQIIVVESVDQMDESNMVLVNSLKDDNTAVIWMLPNAAANDEADDNQDSDDSDVVIEDEPL